MSQEFIAIATPGYGDWGGLEVVRPLFVAFWI